MALNLAAPVHLAAIDAGSNALRLLIARATSAESFELLHAERAAVRLGHNSFTRGRIPAETIARAVRAFRRFHRRMAQHHVATHRAVATSAAREARNSRTLVERIRRKTGIELEIISGEEEASLVCAAVRAALGSQIAPRLIFDLGGGSLELNFLKNDEVERRIPLPLGTVRLMETYRVDGAMDDEKVGAMRHHIHSMLQSALPEPPNLSGGVAVACGGNAEALAQLAPGPRLRSMATLNPRVLRDRMWQMLRLDVPGRMRALRVRRDRADVIGIAAIIIDTLGRYLSLRSMLVPGVGVREGVLLRLMAAQYGPMLVSEVERKNADLLRDEVEWFARRHQADEAHATQVRELALSLFDQLRPLHRMEPEMRLVLELGATLHDVGHFIHSKAHHRHGEYLIRYGEIPGLDGWRRDAIACLVRFHNAKSEPGDQSKLYFSLDGVRRRQVRFLSALLRIAEKLESDHRQGVRKVEVDIIGDQAVFRVHTRNGTRLDLEGLARKASLFERELGLRATFRRASIREKVA